MRNGTLLFGEEGVFGEILPISLSAWFNLRKSVKLLEDGSCDFVYVALDHLENEKRAAARRYIGKYIKKLAKNLRSKVTVSATHGLYFEKFTDFIMREPFHICVTILSRSDEWAYVEKAIVTSFDSKVGKIAGIKTFLLYTK